MLQCELLGEYSHCRKCDVAAITKKVGECVLPNHELARNDLCVHIQPDLTKKGVCTPLQLAVIKHCTNNCHKCDVKDMQVGLSKCTISGIPQHYGTTFCGGSGLSG